jgi:hypothetical protein
MRVWMRSRRGSSGSLEVQGQGAEFATDAILGENEDKHVSKTQNTEREMNGILDRLTEWAGSRDQAMAWRRTQPIPGFGDRTAEELVEEGRAAAARTYIERIPIGGCC